MFFFNNNILLSRPIICRSGIQKRCLLPNKRNPIFHKSIIFFNKFIIMYFARE
jgi:hypothetical protein